MRLANGFGFYAQNATRGFEAHCTLQPRTSAAICLSFPRSPGNSASGNAFVPSERALAEVVMNFEEDTVHAHGGFQRARSGSGDKFRLASARFPLATRQLHRMGHVKHHGTSRLSQNRKGAHVHDEILISEGSSALGQDDAIISRLGHFFNGVRHFPRREELPFFQIDHAA